MSSKLGGLGVVKIDTKLSSCEWYLNSLDGPPEETINSFTALKVFLLAS